MIGIPVYEADRITVAAKVRKLQRYTERKCRKQPPTKKQEEHNILMFCFALCVFLSTVNPYHKFFFDRAIFLLIPFLR